MPHAKNRMHSLARSLAKTAAPARGRQAAPAAAPLTPLTIKLPPDVVTLIVREVGRRKGERLPNRTIQAVITELVRTNFGGGADHAMLDAVGTTGGKATVETRRRRVG